MTPCKKEEDNTRSTELFRLNFPEKHRIWASPMRRNFTEIMNDIMFSGGSNESGTSSPYGALLTLLFTSVTHFY